MYDIEPGRGVPSESVAVTIGTPGGQLFVVVEAPGGYMLTAKNELLW